MGPPSAGANWPRCPPNTAPELLSPGTLPLDTERNATATESGLDRFVALLESNASRLPPGRGSTARFVMLLGDQCAYIRPQDIRRPVRFLRQMAGQPPLRFGTTGFNPAIIDDQNPVRHYVAFVVVGFWLPALLAVLVLLGWEILGFVRYGGRWSRKDVLGGWIGLRHGRRVRRMGPWLLPALVRRDLGAHGGQDAL